MTAINAQNHFNEVVTQEVLVQAIERGRKRAGLSVHATSVQYVAALGSLLVGFADQSAVSLPIKNYPELAVFTESELAGLQLGVGGAALCSDTHDLHVSIAGMVSASEPLMEMAATLIAARNGAKSTAAKAKAARTNGKNGGRPRTVRTIPANA